MSNADLNRQALWMGVAPSFKELGATMGTWYSSGGELLQDFNEVWTCNTHMEMTAMMVRRPRVNPAARRLPLRLQTEKGPLI